MLRGSPLAALLVALALFAGFQGVAATSGEAGNTIAITRVPPLEALLLDRVNAVRAANGLAALKRAPALNRAATFHSRAMATFGFFTHESRDGLSFATRIKRFYAHRSREWTVGENLAMSSGSVDADAILSAWMASPGHRANLLRGSFREAGIAVVHHPSAGGVYGGLPTWVVTLDFGRR